MAGPHLPITALTRLMWKAVPKQRASRQKGVCAWRESNPRPLVHKTSALPIELQVLIEKASGYCLLKRVKVFQAKESIFGGQQGRRARALTRVLGRL